MKVPPKETQPPTMLAPSQIVMHTATDTQTKTHTAQSALTCLKCLFQSSEQFLLCI